MEIKLDDAFDGVIKITKNGVAIASLSVTVENDLTSKVNDNCYRVCVAYDDEGRCIYWNTVCDLRETAPA